MANHRQLIIVRHGKSSWKYSDISDIDRHLKERGIHDAYTMAERLKERKLFPDLIISSPATRALHTALIFSRSLTHPLDKLQLNDTFYHGDDRDVLNVIQQTPENMRTLMIFGHNPTFTDLANQFFSQETDNLPTAGIAFLKFEAGQWADIEKKKILEEWMDYPKKNH